MNPHPNQYIAAEQVIASFLGVIIHYVILQASVQSGKTGTYHTVIRRMFEEGKIDEVVILCGSNEVQLREQFKQDVKEWHPEERQPLIHILFRQNMNARAVLPSRRVLIVVDESHMVSKEDQTVGTFLARYNLSLYGTTQHMLDNQIYLLSVSATPYAERSDMCYQKKEAIKKHVILQNGEGYFGPREYWNEGLVQPTWNLEGADGVLRFQELLRRSSRMRKYAIVRVNAKTKAARLFREHVAASGIRTLEYTIEYEDAHHKRPAIAFTREQAINGIPCILDAPPAFTIIYVDSRLRCGKRLVKDHIAWIWETSHNTKTDTAIQSLWGRMCGYDVPAQPPMIYLPAMLFRREKQNKIIQSCEIERAIGIIVDHEGERESNDVLPRNATHLQRGRVQERAIRRMQGEVYPCVPLCFQFPPGQAEYQALHAHCGQDLAIKALCLEQFIEHLEEFLRLSYFTNAQRQEIRGAVPLLTAEDTHVRHYRGISSQKQHRSHVEGHRTQTAASEHLTGHPFLTFCVTYEGFQPMEGITAIPGEVFVILYTQAKGVFKRMDIASRMPPIKDGTYFEMPHPVVVDHAPAGMFISFSPAIYTDPAAFEQEFRGIVEGSRMAARTGAIASRMISSIQQNRPICLPKTVYPEVLLRTMLLRMETDNQVRIRVRIDRGVQGANVHAIQWMEWEDA